MIRYKMGDSEVAFELQRESFQCGELEVLIKDCQSKGGECTFSVHIKLTS